MTSPIREKLPNYCKMKIFLIGLSGSGKTTLGKELCEEQGIKFIDLDQEIEKKEGTSVGEIFSRKGEEVFRQVEADTLRSLANEQNDFLMATGGGAPCFYDSMTFINEQGVSVFLDVSPEKLVERLQSKGLDERPLLNTYSDEELLEKIKHLRSLRMPVYKQSALRITEDNITSSLLWKALQPFLKS